MLFSLLTNEHRLSQPLTLTLSGVTFFGHLTLLVGGTVDLE